MEYSFIITVATPMKKGFMLYSLIIIITMLCVMATIGIRTIGIQAAALQIHHEGRVAHSLLLLNCAYSTWLIKNTYDHFLSLSQAEKALVVSKTPFGGVLRCGTAMAWGDKNGDQMKLYIVAEHERRCCRWSAHKEGGALVFSGHTFTTC